MSIVKDSFATARNARSRYVAAVLLAGWLLQPVNVAVPIRGGSYGQKDPSRPLLAS